jgi:hypothetical protein
MDFKQTAITALAANFPLLGTLLEDATFKKVSATAYNATTGVATVTSSTQDFKTIFLSALDGYLMRSYSVSIVEGTQFRVSDLKIIVPCSDVTQVFEVNDLITRKKDNKIYRILAVTNFSDIVYIAYLRSADEES